VGREGSECSGLVRTCCHWTQTTKPHPSAFSGCPRP